MCNVVTVSDAQDLAQNIAAARNAAGWSRARLAEELQKSGLPNWHATTVARVETGQREVRVGELSTIARAFGLPPDMLLGPPEQFRTLGDYLAVLSRFVEADISIREMARRRHQAAKALLAAVERMEADGIDTSEWTDAETLSDARRVIDDPWAVVADASEWEI